MAGSALGARLGMRGAAIVKLGVGLQLAKHKAQSTYMYLRHGEGDQKGELVDDIIQNGPSMMREKLRGTIAPRAIGRPGRANRKRGRVRSLIHHQTVASSYAYIMSTDRVPRETMTFPIFP
jgi:hypothetical protein